MMKGSEKKIGPQPSVDKEDVVRPPQKSYCTLLLSIQSNGFSRISKKG